MTDDFITGAGFDEFDPQVAARAEDQLHDVRVAQDEAVLAHVRRTKEAYSRVFKGGNPTADDLDFVMRDMAWFVKADQMFFQNPREQDRFAGRKEVFQRISEYTGLDFETLVKRYIETQN